MPSVCKSIIPDVEADGSDSIVAEASVTGSRIISILVSRLVTDFNTSKRRRSIARAMNPHNLGYTSVLETFKIEHEDCLSAKDDDDSKALNVINKDNNRKIVLWSPIFKDCLSNYCRSRGPLICVLRNDSTVPDEIMDPFLANCYCGESASLISELDSRLPCSRHFFNNDNEVVCMKIEEGSLGTSVESTIKSFSRRKDGRVAFQDLIINHSSEAKHRSMSKKRLNLL